MMNLLRMLVYLLVSAAVTGCGKYLEVKADSALLTPSNEEDLIRLLNNELLNQSPFALLPGTDEFFISDAGWQNSGSFIKQAYIWDPLTQQSAPETPDWNSLYTSIYYANTILYEANRMDGLEQAACNRIRGAALFFRSFIFYQLLQVYAPAFRLPAAYEEPGIVLRLSPDMQERSVRSSIYQCYQQVEKDLQESLLLLPASLPADNKPSSASAAALLARLYLNTGDFLQAQIHAGLALAQKTEPVDFNSFENAADYRSRGMREEMFFYASAPRYAASLIQVANIDTLLYQSYAPTDLRKQFYFDQRPDGYYQYRGHGVPNNLFNGITTGELYLIRAEASARLGNTAKALQDLNYLLNRRYSRGSFTPLSTSDAEQVLTFILQERKKELIFHGTRWSDIKRLNLDDRFSQTLKRQLSGTTYKLPPGDPRFAYLLPDDVIRITGMPQNKR